MKTIRLTLAQAIVRFLKSQSVERDRQANPFFAGVWGIFGHGLVAGIGQALVNLVFDTGHYVLGCGPDAPGSDGEVVPALERYAERIKHVHFKDSQPERAARSCREGWDYIRDLKEGIFCELGRGCVDFAGVHGWLNRRNYLGFVLVEQDLLPGMGTPTESALRNRQFLRSIGF